MKHPLHRNSYPVGIWSWVLFYVYVNLYKSISLFTMGNFTLMIYRYQIRTQMARYFPHHTGSSKTNKIKILSGIMSKKLRHHESYWRNVEISQIARFMGPTWDPPGSCRPQVGPMLAPWTLLSGMFTELFVAHNVSDLTANCGQLACSLYTELGKLQPEPVALTTKYLPW